MGSGLDGNDPSVERRIWGDGVTESDSAAMGGGEAAHDEALGGREGDGPPSDVTTPGDGAAEPGEASPEAEPEPDPCASARQDMPEKAGPFDRIKASLPPQLQGRRGALILSGGAILVAAVIVSATYLFPASIYAQAEEALGNREFDRAQELYGQVSTFGDSQEKLSLVEKGRLYVQAEEALEAGDFDRAESLFGQASGYEDADERKVDAHRRSAYAKASELYKNGDYKNAQKYFEVASGYEDADDRNEECRKRAIYADGVSEYQAKNYRSAADKFLEIVDFENSANQAATCADALVATEAYKDAAGVYGKLGDKYADKASAAKTNASYAEKVEASKGKTGFNDAIGALDGVPDSFTYKGVNVGQRKAALQAATAVLPAVGEFRANADGALRVLQDHPSTGIQYWWDGTDENRSCYLKVSARLNDDGSVALSGTVEFMRYTNYSSVGSLIDWKEETRSFSANVRGLPGTIQVDDNTKIWFSDNSWHLSYDMWDTFHDVYFNYQYTSQYTYCK